MAGRMTCADGVGTYVDMASSEASMLELSTATGGAALGQLLALMGQRPPYKYSGLGEAGRAMTRVGPDDGRALAVALWVAVRSAGGEPAPTDAGHAAAWEALAAAGRQAIAGMGEVACCVTLRTANEAQGTAAGLQLVGRNPFTAVGNAIFVALQRGETQRAAGERALSEAAVAAAGAGVVLGAGAVPGPNGPVLPGAGLVVPMAHAAPQPVAAVTDILQAITPPHTLTDVEVIEKLGGAERLGGLLTRSLGLVHDAAFMPWTEPEVLILIVTEWVPAVARLAQAAGTEEPDRPVDWSAAKLLMMRLAEVAAKQRGVQSAAAAAA